MTLNKWYEKGIPTLEYMDSMGDHKENSLHIYRKFTLPDDDTFFESVKNRNLRVIALAEDWCGHCMLDVPILLRLTEKIDLPVRFLRRDENLALMDQYLTNGKSRTIPIFIFIDEHGNEVTKWGPISEYTKQITNKYKDDLPHKDADDYQEKFSAMIKETTKLFTSDAKIWDGVYDSLKQTLENIKDTE